MALEGYPVRMEMRTEGMNFSSSTVSLDITVDDKTAMWESLQTCIHQFGNTV